MALGGANIVWNENVPSGTSQAGLGDDDLKSIKTSVRNALDSEHIYSSTGGAGSGAHRKGSAVAFYGAASAVSSSDTEGRMMITSDTSRLFHVASAVTQVLGGQYAVLAHPVIDFSRSTLLSGSKVTSAITQEWGMEMGSAVMVTGSGSTTITLANTWVHAVAFVSGIQVTGDVPVISTQFPGSVGNNTLAVQNSSISNNGTNVVPAFPYSFHYLVIGYKSV